MASQPDPSSMFDLLGRALTDIWNMKGSNHRYVELHTAAVRLTLNSSIRPKLVEFVQKQFERRVQDLYLKLKDFTSLQELVTEWKQYELAIGPQRPIPLIFQSLNEVRKKDHQTTIYQMALMAFAVHLILMDPIKPRLQEMLRKMVRDSRSGQTVDSASVKTILQLFLLIQNSDTSMSRFFYDMFEDQMQLEALEDFSPIVGQGMGDNCYDYVTRVSTAVDKEMEHAAFLLPVECKERLKKSLEGLLLDNEVFGSLKGLLNRSGGIVELLASIPLTVSSQQQSNISTGNSSVSFSTANSTTLIASNTAASTSEISSSDTSKDSATNISSTSITTTNAPLDPLVVLSNIFKTCKCRPDCVPIICNIIKEQMDLEAKNITNSEEYKVLSRKTYIGDILALKSKYEMIAKKAFSLHLQIQQAVINAFPEIVKSTPTMGNALSFHYSTLISSVSTKDEEFQAPVSILSYLKSLDDFEHFYLKQMQARLLKNDGSNETILEHEDTAIKAIAHKIAEPAKLRYLLMDFKASLTLRTTWFAYSQGLSSQLPSFTFGGMALKSAHWSGRAAISPIWPSELKQCVDSFSLWFTDKVHQRSKLTWLSPGSAELRYKCHGKTWLLHLESTVQLLVFLQFNQKQQQMLGQEGASSDSLSSNLVISTKEFSESIQLPNETIARVLAGASSKKCPLLLCSNGDQYSLNPKFTSPKTSVRVPLANPPSAISAQDAEDQAEIKAKRSIVIKACIVRVMKGAKALDHQPLIADVIALIGNRFTPDITIIKAQIGALIEEGYLERDMENHKRYIYKP